MELQPPRRRNFYSTNQPTTHNGNYGQLCAKSWRLSTGDAFRSLVRDISFSSYNRLNSHPSRSCFGDARELEKLTIPIFLASFPLFRAHHCSHNLRTLGNRSGPMLVNEQPNTHQFRGSSSRRRHSPLLGLPKHRRILCSNLLNLRTMTCFLPGRNSPIDLTISEMVDKGSVASSEPAASLKQATLTSSLLWAEMLLLRWLKIAEAP